MLLLYGFNLCNYLYIQDYIFAINSPAAFIGTDIVNVAQTISGWGFTVTAEEIKALTTNIGEQTILSRTGGAPTFAIRVALVLHELFGGIDMMGFWYHLLFYLKLYLF